MEIAYLIAGKRFQARCIAELNRELAKYGLVSNLSIGGIGSPSARRLKDIQGTLRYEMIQSAGDFADYEDYDLIVGKIIGSAGRGQSDDIIEKELSELEIALNEVKTDIPDAKIIAGSYWI